MAISEEAQEYKEEFEWWASEYGDSEFLENTPENWEKVQQMDTRLVWTDHGTCEDPQITSGARMYSGRCCWDTYGWYVRTKPWEESSQGAEETYISFKTGAYVACPTCNPEGENDEAPEDCPGDTQIATDNGCEDGWIQYYFD